MLNNQSPSPLKRNSIFSSGGGGADGRGGGRSPSSNNNLFKKKTNRGRFSDGVWYCDCEPRLPGNRFQTKNKGVNHGRWCMSFCFFFPLLFGGGEVWGIVS